MFGNNNQKSQPKTYSGENEQSYFKPKQWGENQTSKMADKITRKFQTRANGPKPELAKRQSVGLKAEGDGQRG